MSRQQSDCHLVHAFQIQLRGHHCKGGCSGYLFERQADKHLQQTDFHRQQRPTDGRFRGIQAVAQGLLSAGNQGGHQVFRQSLPNHPKHMQYRRQDSGEGGGGDCQELVERSLNTRLNAPKTQLQLHPQHTLLGE